MNAVMNPVQEQTACACADQPQTERAYVMPEVNIYETQEGYVLEADMPGVSKEGLEITLEGNELTLVGRRQPVKTAEGEPLYRESNRADFRRAFELDPAIDTTRISAAINQGVLVMTLPKAEQVKPRKITVS
jgi:HSP20 family protein